MLRKIFFSSLFVLFSTLSWSQSLTWEDIQGDYRGYPWELLRSQRTSQNFVLAGIDENNIFFLAHPSGGAWMEKLRIQLQKGKDWMEQGNHFFRFEVKDQANSSTPIQFISVTVMNREYRENFAFDGVNLTIQYTNGDSEFYDLSKSGGNPVVPEENVLDIVVHENKSDSVAQEPKKELTTATPIEFPEYKGKYRGNDLLTLMGRHLDDPAIREFMKRYEIKNQTQLNSKMIFFQGNDFELLFSENLLISMFLSKHIEWPYRIESGDPISSLMKKPVSFKNELKYFYTIQQQVEVLVSVDLEHLTVDRMRLGWDNAPKVLDRVSESEKHQAQKPESESIVAYQAEEWLDLGIRIAYLSKERPYPVISSLRKQSGLDAERPLLLYRIAEEDVNHKSFEEIKKLFDAAFPMVVEVLTEGSNELQRYRVTQDEDKSLHFERILD
ncbi:MAG: hypothetical protein EP338_05025 [Bacteroidetes bacterium]|nr:MAG: hypothetical protein EP338_05025 [Bacteroidota bacterium]